MATNIQPIFLTPTDAEKIGQSIDAVEALRRQVVEGNQTQLQEIPAKLTAYDSTTGAFSWTRQIWDSVGQRVDNPNGQTGTPTHSPAYAIGNGDPTALTFPVEVMLRKTVNTITLQTVYEFDLNGTSESGSTVEIGEPRSSGVTPPTNYLDWGIVDIDVPTGNLSSGELVWVRDANG